jgi:hypothetical protein
MTAEGMHSKRNARRNLYRWMAAGPVVVLLAVMIWAWPYMAITEPSGAKVLVVEGWMDPPALEQAAHLALDSGYTKVYTTGTVRAFAYYLGTDEGVEAHLHDPASGTVEVWASGLPGSGFLLVADADTVLRQAITPKPTPYSVRLASPVKRIMVSAWQERAVPRDTVVYVSSCTVHGTNINLLQDSSAFTRRGVPFGLAWPTYAQSARAALMRHGVPPARITAVPAYGDPRSRSWGNAHAFAQQARTDGIGAFDLATVGVHARRSRNLFRTACGPQVRVGVIALHDPFCTRSNWWHSYRGWYTVIKEVVGAPEAQAVKIEKLR